MCAAYNDWETDLSSIIEKTNQNLKLLRRIGEKRVDDVSAAGHRRGVSGHYGDDGASRPRVLSAAASTATGGGRIHRRDDDPDAELHAAARAVRRSASAKTLKAATIRVPSSDMPSEIPNYVLDDVKKSLEMTISSRSSVFEKRIGDLRADFTVLTSETAALGHKFAELRDSVLSKMSSVPGVLQSLQESADAIARLEKHSAALLSWKTSMDEDLFHVSSKVKHLAALQDKMAVLESNLDALATALKNRPRHDEKIATLQDKLAAVERSQARFTDMKAVESLLNIRLPREFHDVEGRMSQSVAFVAEKVEAKLHSLDKALQSQRAEALAALKSELAEDIQRLSSSALRKSDVVPLQNAHSQLKEDMSQLNMMLERQDKRLQDFKQSSLHVRDEIAETKQELTRALHAQQSRVSSSFEEKLAQLSALSKEKSAKVELQMAALTKKQKKAEESAQALQEDIAKVRLDIVDKQNASHALQQKENEKLRQRLARSVAELETLALAKEDVERRYGKKEKQLQAKLKTLHAKLEESERAKEAERLELVQRIQEETKRMGIAQGKNALLEALLAKEKLQSAEKNELLHKARQEMNTVRQKMRAIESEGELKMHKLASELHSKQLQVDTLLKKLKKSEEEAAKLLETSKREAKAARRAKVAKEHQLVLAKLKLKELESAAATLSLQSESGNGSTQSAVSLIVIEEAEAKRKVAEELLLESQLQVEELTQEIDELRKEYKATSSHQRALLDDQMTKLSSEYELKIAALTASVAAKDHAISRLRETLVERSELDAVSEELRALKDEKTTLVATLDRTRLEHASTIQDQASKTRQLHEQEMDAIKRSLESKTEEVEDAQADITRLKVSVAKLESDLHSLEGSHTDEVSLLTEEMQEVRSQIEACTIEAETLRAEKRELENELERVQSELEQLQSDANDSEAELSEKLGEQEREMQRQIDEISGHLEATERELAECRSSDEAKRRKLLEMVSEQEDMERRLKAEIDTLVLALEREKESSTARAQELEHSISAMRDELELVKLESEQTAASHEAAIASEVSQVTDLLNESLRREQRLQDRLAAIMEEIVRAARDFDADAQIAVTGDEAGDMLAMKYLTHFSATQRGMVGELESLQAESEATARQAAEDAATIKTLDAQVKLYSSQVEELENVVKQLQSELKELYAKSATRSEDLEQEIAVLKKQTSELERVLATQASEYQEKQASFDRLLEAKAHQVEALRSDNEKMEVTISSIRHKMESIEASKVRELDEMNTALSEMEARAAIHSAKSHTISHADLDKDFYASHHESVALAQSIRSLQLKLTKSVGVVEWSDLRASVFAEEDKLERLLQEKTREVGKIGSVEEEVLLNADFLTSVLALRESGDERDDWISKYVKRAPEMAEKLKCLEARLHDSVSKQHAFAMASASELAQLRDAGASSRLVAGMASQSSVNDAEDQRANAPLRRLSESGVSEDYKLESGGHIRDQQEEDDDDGDGMLIQESLDESSMLSESAALDESSLDTSLKTDEREQSGDESHEDADAPDVRSGKDYAIDSREDTSSCANSPSELPTTTFVSSRQAAMLSVNDEVDAAPIAIDRSPIEVGNADEFDAREGAAVCDDDDHDIDSEGSEDEEKGDGAFDAELKQSADIPSHEPSSVKLADDLEESEEPGEECSSSVPSPVNESTVLDPAQGDHPVAATTSDKQLQECENEEVDGHEASNASTTWVPLSEGVRAQEEAAESGRASIDLDVARAAYPTESPLAGEGDNASPDDEPGQPLSDRGSFASHESDDENLAEFDGVETQRHGRYESESEDEDDQDSIEARDLSVQGAAHIDYDEVEAEEEEHPDDEGEDGMEAVERMLLAESQDAGSDFKDSSCHLTSTSDMARRDLSTSHQHIIRDGDDGEDSMEDFADDDTADESSGTEEVAVHHIPLSMGTANGKHPENGLDDGDEEEEPDETAEERRGERAMNAAQTDASFPSPEASHSLGDLNTTKRTAFGRTSAEDTDEDLDEVERLMGERSGFDGRNTFASRETRSAPHAEDDANLSDNDDELIDSESEDEHESSKHSTDEHLEEEEEEEEGEEELEGLHPSNAARAPLAMTATSTRPSEVHESHEERLEASDDERSSQSESIDGDLAESIDEESALPIRQLDGDTSTRAPSTVLSYSVALSDSFSRSKSDAGQPRDDDSGGEEDEFGFGSRQPELTLPAAPTKLLPSTLAPLSSSSSLSGAGALMKALSAARRDFGDDDDDDDVDDVEQLMAAQSFVRSGNAASASALSTVDMKRTLGKAVSTPDEDNISGSDDDEEYGAMKYASHVSKPNSAAMRFRQGDDEDEFEEHELDRSPHDEHDESFDDMRDHAVAQHGGDLGSDDDESTLEEDDDMDEVERLLLEQTAAKHPSNHIAHATSVVASVARYAVVDEEALCDEEASCDEESTGDLRLVTAESFATGSHSIDSHDVDDDQSDGDVEKSAVAASSQQESSFDDASLAGDLSATDYAPSEDSLDEQARTRASIDLQSHQRERRGQANMDTAVSDSSDSEDDEEATSSRSSEAVTTRHMLAPLQLTKSATSLSLGRRQLGGLEEDDDMDEVERLLAAQTSMKSQQHFESQRVTSRGAQNTSNSEFDEEESDEFGENSLEALMDEPHFRHGQADQEVEHAAGAAKRTVRNDDNRGDIDSDSEGEEEEEQPFVSRADPTTSPDASPNAATRIPIFNGSSLADRVGTDAIPSMLSGGAQAAAGASTSTAESDAQQQFAKHVDVESGEIDNEEEEEDDYMEESFDLEESLQDDEDE